MHHYCAHIVDYYKHLAGGNVCEHALTAAYYELASRGLLACTYALWEDEQP